MHLVAGAFLHIDEGILAAGGLLTVKIDLKLTVKNIEALLHIRMHMGNGGLAGFELCHGYLRERTARLIAGEKDTLLPHSMRRGDGLYIR